MAARTLYEKLWDSHLVREEADGTALLYIDRHLVHEVTSPQAFEGLEVAHRKPWRIDSVVATADHNVPTHIALDQGIADPISRLQVTTLDENVEKFHVKTYFGMNDRRQGIVHVIGPEQGATLPGHDGGVRRFPHQHAWCLRLRSPSASARARSSTCSPRNAWCRRRRRRCLIRAEGRAAERASRRRISCSPSSARSAPRAAPAR